MTNEATTENATPAPAGVHPIDADKVEMVELAFAAACFRLANQCQSKCP